MLKVIVNAIRDLRNRRTGKFLAKLGDTGWTGNGESKAAAQTDLQSQLCRAYDNQHKRTYRQLGMTVFALYYAGGWWYDIVSENGSVSHTGLGAHIVTHSQALCEMDKHVMSYLPMTHAQVPPTFSLRPASEMELDAFGFEPQTEFPVMCLSLPTSFVIFEVGRKHWYVLLVRTKYEARNQGWATKVLREFIRLAKANSAKITWGEYTDDGAAYLKHVVKRLQHEEAYEDKEENKETAQVVT